MKKQMSRIQRGFTLIELMIVVAIIGILAAIAIPQYQDYVTRSRWSDNVSSVGALKMAVAECLQNRAGTVADCDSLSDLNANGFWPSATAYPTIKFGAASPVSMAAAGTTGVDIVITGNAQVKGCVVTLRGTMATGNMTWDAFHTASTDCTRGSTGFNAGS